MQSDVLAGFVSYESALEDYGVVLDTNTGGLDEGASNRRRRELREAVKLFHHGGYVDEIW